MKRSLEVLFLLDDRGKAVNCHLVGNTVEFLSPEAALDDLDQHRRELIAEGTSANPVVTTLPLAKLELLQSEMDRIVSMAVVVSTPGNDIYGALCSLLMFVYNAKLGH